MIFLLSAAMLWPQHPHSIKQPAAFMCWAVYNSTPEGASAANANNLSWSAHNYQIVCSPVISRFYSRGSVSDSNDSQKLRWKQEDERDDVTYCLVTVKLILTFIDMCPFLLLLLLLSISVNHYINFKRF